MTFHVPNIYRIRKGEYGSDDSYGNCGAFRIKGGPKDLLVIASDGAGWEHVSVSVQNRCPTWEEMCRIKNLFWDAEDCVVQYHPPQSAYINHHRFCLHLWRPIEKELPIPDPMLVGPAAGSSTPPTKET
jgi:hypothetical protein